MDDRQIESLIRLISHEGKHVAVALDAWPTLNPKPQAPQPARLNPVKLSPNQWEQIARYLIKKENNND